MLYKSQLSFYVLLVTKDRGLLQFGILVATTTKLADGSLGFGIRYCQILESGDKLTGNLAPDTVGHGTYLAGIVGGKGPEIITNKLQKRKFNEKYEIKSQ